MAKGREELNKAKGEEISFFDIEKQFSSSD